MTTHRIEPFEIHVGDERLDDLNSRLDATRWPSAGAPDWADGTDRAFLERLMTYWRRDFDWRRIETELNALPHVRVRCDGLWIHAVHVRSPHEGATPLVLTHGWPGSFVELLEAGRRLADPVADGGDPRDAFHVVIPSLPGFGFSEWRPGLELRAIAELWLELMTALGYERFGAQGGDWGAGVSTELALAAPQRLLGVHLNYVMHAHLVPFKAPSSDRSRPDPGFSAEELAYYRDVERFAKSEGAYAHLQGTKPQSLAYALDDSPSGLAGWIVEKFHSWSDCGGDLESIFTFDQLLTNIAVYWHTKSIATSMRLYRERNLAPRWAPAQRPDVPFGIASYPKEISRPPRGLVERSFFVSHYATMERGGHFAAFEQPSIFVDDVRSFFRSRPGGR